MNHLLMKKRAFMAIANQIKGIKATKTGTFPVTLPGCVDNDCTVGYKIYGNTVTGKNVFDITKCTDYKSEHGGMYFSASRPRGGHYQGKVSAVTNMEAGKTYVITADTTSSSGNFVYLNGSAKVWRWGQAYTPTEKDIAGNIYFYKATNDTDPDVSQEVTITNVQIEEAAAATEYEPYHESYVGDRTKNLLNFPEVCTFAGFIKKEVNIPVGKYTVSWSSSVLGGTNPPTLRLNDNAKSLPLAANGGSWMVTLTKPETIVYLYSNGYSLNDSAGTTSTVNQLMLEQGETATAYEPYGYKIPLKASGKNVFDITKCISYRSSDNSIWISPNAQRAVMQGNVKDITKMQAGKTYIITANSTSSTGHFVYLNGSKKVWWWGQKYTPTQADIDGWIAFYKATNDSEEGVTTGAAITNVQIEEAAAATEYEPYHAPVTMTISLPAPLSAGEYISYTAQAIIHADDTKTSVSLPKIPTYKGTTILECNTENAPASAEITYYTNEEE